MGLYIDVKRELCWGMTKLMWLLIKIIRLLIFKTSFPKCFPPPCLQKEIDYISTFIGYIQIETEMGVSTLKGVRKKSKNIFNFFKNNKYY